MGWLVRDDKRVRLNDLSPEKKGFVSTLGRCGKEIERVRNVAHDRRHDDDIICFHRGESMGERIVPLMEETCVGSKTLIEKPDGSAVIAKVHSGTPHAPQFGAYGKVSIIAGDIENRGARKPLRYLIKQIVIHRAETGIGVTNLRPF